MRRISFFTLFLVVFIFALNTSLYAATKKVGVIAPLTGPLSDIGTTVRNCVSLRDEEKDTHHKVEFIVEDDGFNPRATVAALHKLISSDKIDALMVFGSSTSLSVADIAEQRKIPFIAMGMSEQIAAGKSYVFRHFSTASSQHAALKQEIQRRKYQSIAIVALAQEAMINMRDVYFADPPAEVVLSEEVIPGDSDLRGIASRIKMKKPDGVYFLLLPPHISSLSRSLRDIGYKGEFFGAAPLQQKGEITAAQGTLENTWFVASDDSFAAKFKKEYLEKFASDPHPDGLPACDAAQFIIELSDEANLAEALREQKKLQGLFGSYELGPNNTFDIPVTVKVVDGSSFVPLPH